MTVPLSRRTLLTAALATGAAVPLGAGRAPAAPGPVRLTLPPPTGPYRIGTVALHLTGRSRELMAGVWYPAAPGSGGAPAVPWMPAAPLAALLAANGFDPAAAAAPLTVARQAAPVRPGRWPVVLYSHGSGGHRSESTVAVQELVSHGYVVVTVDHSDGYTEFPGGRLAVPSEDLPVTPWDHAGDVRFVLDRLEELAAGRNPDAGRRRLPDGLGAVLDLRRTGMFGWSKGATATALVMNTDRRVRAGLGLDGPMQSQPPVTALDRPFLLLAAEFTRDAEPAVERFWSLLRGWRLHLRAEGALHGSYCDQQWLLPQLGRIAGLSDEELAGWIGTLAPARAVRIQQAYPLAFFDLHLRRRRQRLLEGPARAFPEVRYTRSAR